MTGRTPDDSKRDFLVAITIALAAGVVALLVFRPPHGATTPTDTPKQTANAVACTKGTACTVDLSACPASAKARSWADQSTLAGRVELASYTSHFDWVCQVSGAGPSGQPFRQAWPMRPEPKWWCGVVTPTCVCNASDGCR